MLLFSEKAIIEVVTGAVLSGTTVTVCVGVKSIVVFLKDLMSLGINITDRKSDSKILQHKLEQIQTRIFIPPPSDVARIQAETTAYEASVEARRALHSFMKKNPCIILAMILLGSVALGHAGGISQSPPTPACVCILVVALVLDLLLRQYRNRSGYLFPGKQY